jgi:hypothetical protein
MCLRHHPHPNRSLCPIPPSPTRVMTTSRRGMHRDDWVGLAMLVVAALFVWLIILWVTNGL